MENPAHIRVSFYGRLADLVGNEVEIPARETCSVADVRAQLAADYPESAGLLENKRVRACVDDSIVPDSHPIAPGGHVEFLPPVSGG